MGGGLHLGESGFRDEVLRLGLQFFCQVGQTGAVQFCGAVQEFGFAFRTLEQQLRFEVPDDLGGDERGDAFDDGVEDFHG